MRLPVRLLLAVLAAALIAAPALAASTPVAPGHRASARAARRPPSTRSPPGGDQRPEGAAATPSTRPSRPPGSSASSSPTPAASAAAGSCSSTARNDHQVHTIDSRETAPRAMTPTSFQGLTTFEAQRVSGMSVGVPGTPRAWEKALREYGTWSLARALKPGIDVGHQGLRRRPDVLQPDRRGEGDLRRLRRHVGAVPRQGRHPARRGHHDPQPGAGAHVQAARRQGRHEGLLLRRAGQGDRRHRHPAAAAHGLDAHGAPRRDDAHRPQPLPGQGPRADEGRVPGHRRVRRWAPPSSGGTTVGEALNILTAIQAGPTSATSARSPRDRALHFYLEASRYAYADRDEYVGDPSFVPRADRGPAGPRLRRAARVADRRAGGEPARRAGRHAARREQPRRQRVDRVGSTTNMTMTDKRGNVVDYTFTIEQTGGNGMVVPRYGFLLNNELTDFNLSADGSGAARRQPARPAASARARRSRRRSSCGTAARSSRSARPAARRSSPPSCRSSSTAWTSPSRCPTRSPRRA